jgi:carbonic anhydrase
MMVRRRLGLLSWIMVGAVSVSAEAWRFSPPEKAHDLPSHEKAAVAHAALDEDVERESSGESLWEELMDGNRRFQDNTPDPHDWARERRVLAKGQKPGVIVFTCSDSRVPPELVFDQSLGRVFVVRTAGHVQNRHVLASIEYAAEHLHAKLLVVMGHEKCGAVTAAASSAGDGETENIQALIEGIRPSLSPLLDRYQGEELVKRGIEAHIHQTAADLLRRSPILYHLAKENELTIVKAFYNLKSGAVQRLR